MKNTIKSLALVASLATAACADGSAKPASVEVAIVSA